MASESADAGDRRMTLSRDALTAWASITAPLWTVTPARSQISQVSGSICTTPVASQGSGLRSEADRRNGFSDNPDWLATHPLSTGSNGVLSQITPAFRVGRSTSVSATADACSTAAAGAVGCSDAPAAGECCCETVVAAGAGCDSVAEVCAVFPVVAAGAPQATANVSQSPSTIREIVLICCINIFCVMSLQLGFDGREFALPALVTCG